jgi:acetyl-CoA carboxylase biotin carboxyl carrier protein
VDAKELKRVLDAVKDADLSELTLETPDYKLTVKRGGVVPQAAPIAASAPAVAQPQPQAPAPAAAPVTAPQETPPATKSNLAEVTAPIVGTFYASPGPDASEFVKVGDRVKAGQVLCIIEAMKLMNEIEAETAGTVREILVKNEEPVEYGQVLFRLEPA